MADRRNRVRRGTLRGKITAVGTLAVAVGLLAASSAVASTLRRSLEQTMSRSLLVRAREVVVNRASGDRDLPVAGEDEAVVQVVSASGVVLAQSGNLLSVKPIVGLTPEAGTSLTKRVRGVHIRDEAEQPFRLVALGAAERGGSYTVLVANNLDQVDEAVARVRFLLRAGLPFLLVLVALTIWVIVGSALRPVAAIRRQVAEISDGDLALRVSDPGTDDEIGRLARAMNEMLARLEIAAERQARFVADASHELQSPLATILADLEVAAAHPGTIPWEEAAQGVVADVHRMSELIQDLLFLARSENAGLDLETTLVDVDELVRTEVGRLRARSPGAVITSELEPIERRTQPELLGRAVRNLLDNAVRYADSEVRVVLLREASTIVLMVSDDGPGIPVDQRERIFERFARLDDSRSRETGGTGLGLAITREIVSHLGGTISIEDAGSGTRFVLTFPRD